MCKNSLKFLVFVLIFLPRTILSQSGETNVSLSQKLNIYNFYDEIDGVTFLDYLPFRNPARIIRDSIFIAFGNEPGYVQLFYGNPIVSYSDGRFHDPTIGNDFQLSKPYKIDIQIEPHLMYALGAFSDPFQTQIGVAPKIELIPAKGFYGIF